MDSSSKCEEVALGSISGIELLGGDSAKNSPQISSSQDHNLQTQEKDVNILTYQPDEKNALTQSLSARLHGDSCVESAFSPLAASDNSLFKLTGSSSKYSRPKGSSTRIQLFKDLGSCTVNGAGLEVVSHAEVPGPFVKGFLQSPPASKHLIRPKAIGGSSAQNKMATGGTGYFEREIFSPVGADNVNDVQRLRDNEHVGERRRLSFECDEVEDEGPHTFEHGSAESQSEIISHDVNMDVRDDGIPGAEDQSSESSDSDNQSVVEVTSQSGPEYSLDQSDEIVEDQSGVKNEGHGCETDPHFRGDSQTHQGYDSELQGDNNDEKNESETHLDLISPVETAAENLVGESQFEDYVHGADEDKENAPPLNILEPAHLEHASLLVDSCEKHTQSHPLSSTPNAKQNSRGKDMPHITSQGTESQNYHSVELRPSQIPRPSTSPGGQNGANTVSNLAVSGVAKDRRQPTLGVRAQQMNIGVEKASSHASGQNPSQNSLQQTEDYAQHLEPVNKHDKKLVDLIPQKYLQGPKGESLAGQHIQRAYSRWPGQSAVHEYGKVSCEDQIQENQVNFRAQEHAVGQVNMVNDYRQFVNTHGVRVPQNGGHVGSEINHGRSNVEGSPYKTRYQAIGHVGSLVNAGEDIRSMENVREQLHHMLTLSDQALPEKKQYEQVALEDVHPRFPADADHAVNASLDSVSTTDIFHSRGGSSAPYDSVLSYASGMLRPDATDYLAHRKDGSASALFQEMKLSREALEQERYRRKHCEKQIKEVQAKNLELQQQLAIAVSTDKKKDSMIEQLDKALAKVVSGWKKKEAETQEITTSLQHENAELRTKSQAQQELLHKFEKEMAAAMDELTTEQQEGVQLKKEKEKQVAAAEAEAAENFSLLEQERQRLQDIQAELMSTQEAYNQLRQQLSDVSQDLESEHEAWEEKEQDYLQKIDEITENHLSAIGQEREKNERLAQAVHDTQQVLAATQTEVQELQIKLDTACRERESLKVEMGLLEARGESSRRKLEADLRAEHERMMSDRLEEVHNRQMSAEEEMRERHRRQVMELNTRHAGEMEEQLHQFHEDLQKRDGKLKLQAQQHQKKLEECRDELDTLKLANKKLEGQRVEMTSKLQATLQSHCNDVLRLLQGGSLSSLGIRDSISTSVYTTSPIRSRTAGLVDGTKCITTFTPASSAANGYVISSVPSGAPQSSVGEGTEKKVDPVQPNTDSFALDYRDNHTNSVSAGTNQSSQNSITDEDKTLTQRSRSPSGLPDNVTDEHHADPHNVSNMSASTGGFSAYSGLPSSVGVQGTHVHGGPLESTHLSSMTPPRHGVPSLSSGYSSFSTISNAAQPTGSHYGVAPVTQEQQVDYNALIHGLQQYRQQYQPSGALVSARGNAQQLPDGQYNSSIHSNQGYFPRGDNSDNHQRAVFASLNHLYSNPYQIPSVTAPEATHPPPNFTPLSQSSTPVKHSLHQQVSTGFVAPTTSQVSSHTHVPGYGVPSSMSNLPRFGGQLSGPGMPSGGILENQVTRDVTSSWTRPTGVTIQPQSQKETRMLESLIREADVSVQKFTALNPDPAPVNQSMQNSESSFSALTADVTTASSFTAAVGEQCMGGEHGNASNLSMGPLEDDTRLNTSSISQAESGTSSVDYSRMSERFGEHESRQNELQHYIRMLLSKTAGSPVEGDEREPVKDQGGSPRLAGQTTSVDMIGVPVTPPQKQKHVAFSQETTANETKQSNVPAGVLSPQQVGEISRLLGMYRDGHSGAISEDGRPPVEDLLTYLRDLNQGQDDLSGQSPPTPPTMKAKPQASTPTKQATASRARRSLTSTYQVAAPDDKVGHASGKPGSPRSKQKMQKVAASGHGKGGQPNKKPERKVAKGGKGIWK